MRKGSSVCIRTCVRMKHLKWKLAAAAVIIVVLGIYYYIALPAVSIHSTQMWGAVCALILIIGVAAARRSGVGLNRYEIRSSKIVKVFGLFFLAAVIIYAVGAVLSSPVVNAKKYQSLLHVENSQFAKDVQERSFDQIPLMDKETAEILGNRKMGSMVDMVSQFEVDSLYSQINYKDRPVRVSPLRYASPIKWFTNFRGGIPAYIEIDMATQDTKLVKLPEGMKYTEGDHFGRNIYRHLRFRYPTYIFDRLSFEVDEEGTPYWICPVKKFNIGLFGGVTIGRVVLCNAVTGETKDYAISEAPTWIDRAYSADLLISLYNYYGTLKHGFLNSVLGQKDCLSTTDGYNYLAIDDDVWVYTGVTSITGDESNVGFVLMNQRTMETKFYEVEGATESSAMSSAEGQVQNLKYRAAFPLLLNIADEPTYFLALKDDAGLVKKYAMVNVQKYQIVAIGDTVGECKDNYSSLLFKNGIKETPADTRETDTAEGVIASMTQAVIDGNSHYYIILEGRNEIFDLLLPDMIDIIRYKPGDRLKIEYKKDEKVNLVTKIQEGN